MLLLKMHFNTLYIYIYYFVHLLESLICWMASRKMALLAAGSGIRLFLMPLRLGSKLNMLLFSADQCLACLLQFKNITLVYYYYHNFVIVFN